MKKILFALLSVFMCSVAMADVKGFNDITDKGKIDWDAVDAASAEAFGSDKRSSGLMYAFFIQNEGKEVSPKDILAYCKANVKDVPNCAVFAKTYSEHTGGDANDCTVVSDLINTQVSYGTTSTGYLHFKTLKELVGYCHSLAKGANDFRYEGGVRIERSTWAGGAYIGDVCSRALDHLKQCIRHLESYYAKELSKTDLDAKKKKQYSCILNLVQTGQLELPVNLMEKKCK
jgi:hypothetical protein